MSRRYRWLAGLCAASLLAVLITGCGSGSSNKESQIGEASEGKMEISFFAKFPNTYQQIMKDYNDNIVYQELEKKTGVHINWVHPPENQLQEKFTLMIGSGDYPDLIQDENWYPGGPDKAIQDKVYLRLNELIDQHAPNFKKILDTYPEIKKEITTDEGNIYGFPMIELEQQPSWYGPVLRQDWLDELNLPTPETLDDWYTVLKAFKEQKGATAPLSIDNSGFPSDAAFVGAFGVNSGFFQVNNQIKYSPLEQGYKDYLMMMNKWYSEGLVDHDFATSGNQNKEKYVTTGKTGAAMLGFYELDRLEKMSSDSNMKLVAVPYPSMKKGEKPHFRQYNGHIRGNYVAISTKAKNVEEIVKWLDYFYSPEGQILANYGIEGVTFNKEGDKYLFTDMVVNNEEGVKPNIALAKYTLQGASTVRDWSREMFLYTETENEACSIWNDSATADYLLPPFTMNPKEGEEFSKIMSDIDTYVSEMALKFIIGDASFDTYDQFVKKLRDMNIEKAIELQQAAMDRYQARK